LAYFEAIIHLIQVLVWPVVVLIAIGVFRQSINEILMQFSEHIKNVTEAKFLGAGLRFRRERIKLPDLPGTGREIDQ
jgi:hypothetical protein